jgi:hypothetical protein
MRTARRVAKFARQAGAGQPGPGLVSLRSASASAANPQESSVGQPGQPGRPVFANSYVRRTNHEGIVNEPTSGNSRTTADVSSHVSLVDEADQVDQADQGMKSAALSDGEQADHRLTEADGRLTVCAQCQGEIPATGGYTATSTGAYLHNRCVDAWLARP